MIEAIGQQIEKIMKKAARALASAKNLLNDGDSDFASAKAYYAAFHAMQAALLTKSLSFSKHSGVIAAFNQHFIKAGVFPKEFSAIIESLFKERQIGDYSYEDEITKEDAEADINNSEKVVKAIRVFLSKID